jgi:Ni/Co efflux regulator RcnB
VLVCTSIVGVPLFCTFSPCASTRVLKRIVLVTSAAVVLVAEQQQGAFHCEEEVEVEVEEEEEEEEKKKKKKTKVGGETKAGHHSCHSGLVRAEVRHGGDATV